MSGGGGSTNTIQSATPWTGIQPFLNNLYDQSFNQFQSGGPQVYPGNTTAPLNSQQQNALDLLTGIGQNGSYGNLNPSQWQALGTTQGIVQGGDTLSQSLMSGAQGNSAAEQQLLGMANGSSAVDRSLLSTANGSSVSDQFLRGTLTPQFTDVRNNPALNAAMNAANYNTNFNYTNDVMPQLASQFSAAGRFGSGAQGNMINQANNTLASQISNTNAGMSLADLQQLQSIQSQNAGTLGQQETTAGSALGNLQNTASTQLGSLQNANAGLLNNRQGAALQLLPGMSTQGIGNAMTALQSGNQQQAQSQTNLSNLIAQYNQQQTRPYANINWLSQMLSGVPWGTSSSGNTSNVANPYSTAIGAGTLGLGLYNSGLLGGGAAGLGGGALFSAGGTALSGAALDAALAAGSTDAVIGGLGGGGTAALMGLAAA